MVVRRRRLAGASAARLKASRIPIWWWLTGLAIVWGAGILAFAFTVHNRCEASDPSCVFHSYTLVQDVGPGILFFAAAPLAISVVLAALLHIKATRGGNWAHRAAWTLVVLGCIVCLVGLVIAGIVMMPWAAFAIGAAATAPFPAPPPAR
jgi:hypothetical protein